MELAEHQVQELISDMGLIEQPEAWDDDKWQTRCSNIEGGVYDLALESVHYNRDKGVRPYIFEEARSLPSMVPLPDREYNNDAGRAWEIWGEQCYWLQSVETVNLPAGIHGFILPRTSSFRAGLVISGTQVHPGYHGKITVLCYNTNLTPVLVGPNARLFSIKFARSNAEESLYRGVWGGSKLTTSGPERPF